MSKLSRGGIAYDLKLSPFILEVSYEDDSLIYVFSSEYNMKKFQETLEENRGKINESLTKRFGFTIECNKLADIKAYSTREKRGFLILGKEEFNCLDSLKLDGASVMKNY